MVLDAPFIPLAGGCACGRVRFRMEFPPIITHCCHCRDCQTISGSAFRINAMIETKWLTVFDGEAEVVEAAGRPKEVRCAACQSALWSYLPRFAEVIAFVGVGMLDQGERLPPEAHYFTRSKHPWVILPPGPPAFETLGDPGKPGARERITAALATAGPNCSIEV